MRRISVYSFVCIETKAILSSGMEDLQELSETGCKKYGKNVQT